MQKLAEINSTRILDLINERLTFERAGVKLYDQILARMRQSRDKQVGRMLAQMQLHRDHEKEHEEWLEQQARYLGGDAHSPTEHSQLAMQEAKGIIEVVQTDPQIPHLFHALLTAELADNAGWDLLVELAEELGDHDATREFKKRRHEEDQHLVFVRQALKSLVVQVVTGEPQKMPTHA